MVLSHITALPFYLLLVACTAGPLNRAVPSTEVALADQPGSRLDKEQLTFGSFAGECSGYCQVTFTVFPTIVHRKVEPWNNDTVAFPVLRQSIPIAMAQYDSLFARLDRKAFMALGERIGCPDCADGGVEWFALSGPEGKKTVTFDYGADLPTVASFLAAVRGIAQDPRWAGIK